MEQRIIENVNRLRQAGASDPEIEQYLRTEGVSLRDLVRSLEKRRSVSETGIDTESSFMGSLAQGATLGFSDEIMAGARALGGADYGQALQAEQDALARYRDENPGLALTGELAGGLATAWIPGMAPARTLGVGAQMARTAKQGAVLGGVAGFGSTNGSIQDRLAGAGVSAALGGTIGGAVPGAMAAGRAGKERLQDVLGLRSAAGEQGRAQELLALAMLRDGKSPEEIKRLLAEAEASGKPLGIIDVAGQNTLGLARAAANVPSGSKQGAYTALMERAEDAPARIAGDLQGTMGAPAASYLDVYDALQKRLRTNAKPLYDKAYEAGDVTDPAVLDFLSPDGRLRKVLPAAWKEAQDQAALEGEKLTNPFKVFKTTEGEEFLGIDGGVSLKHLDYIKRGLDELIAGSMGNKKRLLRNVKNEFVDLLDEKYPDYKAARAQYKGDAELRDALEAGRAFLNETSDITAAQVSKLSDAEKRVFRIGAITAIRDAINTAADRSDVVRRIFGSPEKRAQLRSVFPSNQAYQKFEQLMKLESQAAQTKNAILSGSRTTPLAQEIEDMGMSPSLMQEFARNPVLAVPRMAMSEVLRNRMQGVRGAVADALNERLYNFNPAQQRGVVDALANTQQQVQQQQLSRQALRNNIGRSLGTVPGLFAE
jgi:hypothetical protein